MRTRICNRCQEEKDFNTEFTRHRQSKGGRLPFCRSCKAIEDREQYEKNKTSRRLQAKQYYHDNKVKRIRAVKQYQMNKKQEAINVLGGKCYMCDETHPAALTFHHRDPSTKSFDLSSKTLSSPRQFPWEIILEEIEKCDLLCHNHHAILHCTWELEK